jgi:hypothetical protein
MTLQHLDLLGSRAIKVNGPSSNHKFHPHNAVAILYPKAPLSSCLQRLHRSNTDQTAFKMSAEPPVSGTVPTEVKPEDPVAPESNATQPPPSSTPAPPATGATGLNKQELDVLDGIVKRMSEARDPEEYV